ncbi:MAG: DNRLRE domain-containing protein [Bacteroidia bacterium]
MNRYLPVLLFLFSLITFSGKAQVTITLQPNSSTGKDAELASCGPCGYSVRNFGTKQDFAAFAWTNGGNTSNARSILQFDLSSIPAGAVITSAVLSLYFNPNSAEGGHVSSFLSTNSCYLQRITSNWNESTVTWNTMPSTTTLHQVTIPKTTSSTQNFPSINVTSLVQDMINNPTQSFGFMMKLKNEVRFNKMIFASSDHPTTNLRPKLVVSYVPPAVAEQTSSLSANSFYRNATTYTDQLYLYPNPARSTVNLNFNSETEGVVSVQVMNITGKQMSMRSVFVTNGINVIGFDVADWGKGMYFVNVRGAHIIRTLRLVVE